MFDEKFALIFHKNFLLTQRSPLNQRASLFVVIECPYSMQCIAHLCPVVQVAPAKTGSHLTGIYVNGRWGRQI